jgi:acyl-CoA dehydrogenase
MTLDTLALPGTIPLDQRAAAVADVAAQHAADVDAAARFPHEAVDAMRAAGLLGASIPVEWGGEGATISELAAVAARLGEACASTAMIYAMHHSQLLSLTRHTAGSAASIELARRIAVEGLLLASATTEIGIGGDVRSSTCFVERDGDRASVSKNAPVISYGEHADMVLVTARRDADSAPSDQVLVACLRDELTLERTGTWDTLGLRGTSSFGYHLIADVPACNVLPAPYDEISTETMLPVSHILWAAVWLGMSRSAADTARASVRAAARKAIGTIPPAATALVGLVTQVSTLQVVVDAAAREFDRIADDRDALGAVEFGIRMNTLKVTASTAVADIVARALSITGIAGFRNDGPYSVARVFRDAQGAAVMVHNDRITANTAQLLLVSKGTR